MTEQTNTYSSSADRASSRVSQRRAGRALFFALLAGGVGVVVPRFFLEVEADSWPGLLWTLSIIGVYLSVSLLLKKRGSPTWRPWYALFVFAAITPMANEWGRALGGAMTSATATPLGSLMTRHLFSTLLPVAGVLVLHRAGGIDLDESYLRAGRLRFGLSIGLGAFILIGFLSIVGADMLVDGGRRPDQLFCLLPWLLAGVLLNGIREEIWFRGVLLRPFGETLGFGRGNIGQSILFALPHLTVTWTNANLGVMVATFALGIALGLLARASSSLLAPVLVHAAVDIPVWLGILAST